MVRIIVNKRKALILILIDKLKASFDAFKSCQSFFDLFTCYAQVLRYGNCSRCVFNIMLSRQRCFNIQNITFGTFIIKNKKAIFNPQIHSPIITLFQPISRPINICIFAPPQYQPLFFENLTTWFYFLCIVPKRLSKRFFIAINVQMVRIHTVNNGNIRTQTQERTIILIGFNNNPIGLSLYKI